MDTERSKESPQRQFLAALTVNLDICNIAVFGAIRGETGYVSQIHTVAVSESPFVAKFIEDLRDPIHAQRRRLKDQNTVWTLKKLENIPTDRKHIV